MAPDRKTPPVSLKERKGSRSGTCRIPGCRSPQVALRIPDGRRKWARECREHLPPRLTSLLDREGHPGTEAIAGNTVVPVGAQNRNTLSDTPRCGAWLPRKKRQCRAPAGWRTSHPGYGTCTLHGGSTPASSKSAARQEAKEAAAVMGLPIDIDPLDALLHCIRITAGEVAYCSQRILELSPAEAMVSVRERTKRRGTEPYTEVRTTTDRQLNAWVSARQKSVEGLARYSKMAIDCGIAERQVQVAERMGEQLGSFIQALLEDLNLSDAQRRRAPAIVQSRMQILDVNPS